MRPAPIQCDPRRMALVQIKEHWINPLVVTRFHESTVNTATSIFFVGGDHIVVMMKAEEVRSKLESAFMSITRNVGGKV